MWSDVFAVDDVSECEDDVCAQLDVNVVGRETRDTSTLMRRYTVVTKQRLRRALLLLLLLMMTMLAGSH